MLRNTLAVSIIIWLCVSTLVLAEDHFALTERCSSSYPGYGSEIGALTSYAGNLIADQVMAFYRCEGRWPADYAEIVSLGLSSGKLYGYRMERIDPDDGSMDFAGDAYYKLHAVTGRPVVASLDPQGRMQFVLNGNGKAPRTYDELAAETGRINDKRHAAVLRSPAQRRAYAILRLLTLGAHTFQALHGRLPRDWYELADSGLAGLDRESLNPLTGRPITGEAGPNEIVFKFDVYDPRKASALVTNGDVPEAGTRIISRMVCDAQGRAHPPVFSP